MPILPIHWPAVLENNTPLARTARFFVRFNILAIPLYAILLTNWQSIAAQKVTADITLWMLHSTGFEAAADGLLISIPILNGQWAAFISWDCTGWKAMLALFALIFATEAHRRKKLFGLTFFGILFLINLVRIWFMFWYVSAFDIAHYSLVHDLVWSWGLIFSILALWLAWAKVPEKWFLKRK